MNRLRKRILLAEDHEVSRKTLKLELESAGFEVLEASDGMVAWIFIRAGERVDAVISDYDMPRMDGLDLLVHMFSALGAENMPHFFLMSGDTVVGEDDLLIPLEVAVKPLKGVFWPKPFDSEEKIRQVRETLSA